LKKAGKEVRKVKKILLFVVFVLNANILLLLIIAMLIKAGVIH